MLFGIVLSAILIRTICRISDKVTKHNMQIFGNYLYQIIREANRKLNYKETIWDYLIDQIL